MSVETTGDPGEAIADAIAEYLKGQKLSLSFVAERPDDPEESYQLERPGLTLLVNAWAEEAERRDRGSLSLETFQTQVVVIRKLTDEFTKARLMRFVREVKTSLRGTRMAGHVWSGDETQQKFDREQIAKMNQFHGAFLTNYLGTH